MVILVEGRATSSHLEREMTDEEIIRQRIAIRDHVAKLTEKFEQTLAPYKAAEVALEGAITERMIAQGQESIRTDAGTAYRISVLSTKVADRDLFLAFVFKTENGSFIMNSAPKEAVREYMEENKGAPPPGVDITYIHKTNFRKPA